MEGRSGVLRLVGPCRWLQGRARGGGLHLCHFEDSSCFRLLEGDAGQGWEGVYAGEKEGKADAEARCWGMGGDRKEA